VPVRRHVYYSGFVQGVGFRYTARRLAQGSGVGGVVRNLADGRVELVVEGEPAAVAGALEAIEAAMDRHIRGAEVLDEPPTGEFREFRVAHDEG
jgi:acylphosphatase